MEESVNPDKKIRRNKGWDNLKPAAKGEVRNPNGRPKNELSIPDLLRKIGDMPFNAKHTYLQQMLTVVYAKAAAGVPWAVEFVADRTEGKAKQDIQLTQIKDKIEIE